MHPTTVIELALVFAGVAIVSTAALFLKQRLRKITLLASAVILLGFLDYYAIRPVIVENQTANAIKQLNVHLTETFKGESWRITDTDDYEITNEKLLHVIFDNEPQMVYEYRIKKSTISQSSFWNLTTGGTNENLLEMGIVLQHRE